ncbi:uncharacterized protein G2W53_015262 [Senna tora]|uniref:Uncharacterized protein n=1 Tax=Senna tora TaxID=362788 RepID=A0A834WV30_9FABA|nr:uncharacterized protein G2W53_015262 [Senna tora]
MEGDFRRDSRRKNMVEVGGCLEGWVGVCGLEGWGWGVRFGGMGWVWKIDGVGGGDLGKSEKEEERGKISGEILAGKYGGDFEKMKPTSSNSMASFAAFSTCFPAFP